MAALLKCGVAFGLPAMIVAETMFVFEAVVGRLAWVRAC